MNVYEKMFDILIAICIMFLFPFLYFSKKSDLLTYETTYQDTEAFVEEVLSQGKLVKAVYEMFYERLCGFDEAFHLTITYEELMYEPIYEKNPTKDIYEFSKEVMEYQLLSSNEEILYALYQEEGEFLMEPGGYLKVKVQFLTGHAIYCGGTVRAYISLCDNICNLSYDLYYHPRYLLCPIHKYHEGTSLAQSRIS